MAAVGTAALVGASVVVPALTTAAQADGAEADGAECVTTTWRTFDEPSPVALTLNGSATSAGPEGSTVLRLTPSTQMMRGSAFTSAKVDLPDAGAFSTFFTFTMTEASGYGAADGIVFVVQGAGDTALGGIGSSLGYEGITPSVGVEFDTFGRFDGLPFEDEHVGIDTNGSLASDPVVRAPLLLDDPDALHRAWVDYDGTTLEVRLADTDERPEDALLTKELDLPAILGAEPGSTAQAHVGFTAATGTATSAHDIHSWAFRGCHEPLSGLPTNSAPVVQPPVVGLTSACTVSATAGFSDPDTGDTHSATIDWGDGTSGAATVDRTAGTAGTVAGTHTYDAAGTYTVTASVADGDGASGQADAAVTTRTTASALGAPLAPGGARSVARIGQTIPLKLTVTDCSGDLVTTLAPTVSLTRLDDDPTTPTGDTVGAEAVVAAANGQEMRWADDAYTYALSTRLSTLPGGSGLTAGTYRISVGDPSLFAPATAVVDLR